MLITISRQFASNGILIGRTVAERLGYCLFDRELVEEVARQLHVSPQAVRHVCEAIKDPVQSFILEWRTSINEHVYVRYLTRALQRIAEESDAVIVGGGANYVLHRPDQLDVRIIAPIELRTAIFRAGNDISEQEARKIITKRDADRAHFVKRVFHQDIEDPRFYDLVLNLHNLTPEMAADQIIDAAKARETAHLQPSTEATLAEHLKMMVHARHHVRPEIVERYRETNHLPLSA